MPRFEAVPAEELKPTTESKGVIAANDGTFGDEQQSPEAYQPPVRAGGVEPRDFRQRWRPEEESLQQSYWDTIALYEEMKQKALGRKPSQVLLAEEKQWLDALVDRFMAIPLNQMANRQVIYREYEQLLEAVDIQKINDRIVRLAEFAVSAEAQYDRRRNKRAAYEARLQAEGEMGDDNPTRLVEVKFS